MTKELAKASTKELSTAFSGFNAFLQQHGLPTENVIANEAERNNVANNLTAFLEGLDDDVKRNARYLSKFVAGTAIGLFYAALNYVWNEVVLNLRKKAAI